MDPWIVELLIVREQAFEDHRRTLAKDVQRGLLRRVRPGVYVERGVHDALSPEQRHVVSMRALAAVASRPPLFSHWSAAVLLGLPVLGREHLERVHVSVEDASDRGLVGVAARVAAVDAGERAEVRGLQVTTPARTVVDIARISTFESGVVTADGALHLGVPRVALEGAVAAATSRKGWRRAQAVVAFADGDAESPAESTSRVTMLRIGIRRPILQWRVFDRNGLAGRLDFGYPWVPAGGETDGEQKYRDASMAPNGAADAVIKEKRREDRVRLEVPRLGRWGYRESRSPRLLAPILARIGVVPEARRVTIADYSTEFRVTRL
ncbi:hypothetical protein [Amnibacterium setariae]|uniref:Type IV toxin-antitoxin system AbiEi family antitoxin domain-containing protein n=1 Tax=Amnibacterium setariae TaxID=2306585 RepID=A0A3A1TWX7_9MICO|nr:hypothetical protein [Amnibacterium setariae]RIX28071.1 hypothetical protein D1781_11325 [Amnibacterium setariae]